MKFHVIDHPPKSAQEKAVLVLHVTQGDTKLPRMAAWIDRELGGKLKQELKRKKFSGAPGTSTLVHSTYGPTVLVGVGKRPVSLDRIREAAAAAVREARAHHYPVIVTPVTGGKRLSAEAVSQAVTEGALLGDYRFDKYKKSSKRPALDFYLSQGGQHTPAAKRGVARGEITAAAQNLARDMVNEPPSDMGPLQLAAEAKKIARTSGLKVQILGKDKIAKAGLLGLLAVAKGSDEPPQLIKLQYAPPRGKRHIVLVGKGITYDTGGINLKPSKGGSLDIMKLDMSGAASVIGAMSALKATKVPVKVTAYVGAAENLVDAKSYKPGDVLTLFNGKTIEIADTDAEGRVTLADVLSYATTQERPDSVVSIATNVNTELALGSDYAGLFANDERLAKQIEAAAQESSEPVWRLPMPERYQGLTKSKIADFSNNSPGKNAYTLSAALLLKNFIGKSRWAHIEFGSPAWADQDSGYRPYGGTGYGVRLLLEYLQDA